MVAIEKSLDTAALASATAVSFKQRKQNNSAVYRPEKLVVIGQAQTGKTPRYNVPALSSGNADDAGVLYGYGSPLHRIACKLFPRNGNGCKVDTYFIPVAAPTTGAAEVKTVAISATSVTKSFNGYIKVQDLPFEAAADIAGKVATRYQKNPAQAPRGLDLNSFETQYIPFTLVKGMTAAEIANSLVDVMLEEMNLPFTPAVVTNDNAVTITLTAKWVGGDSVFSCEIVNEDDETITAADTGVSFTITRTTEAAGTGAIPTEALNALDTEFGVTRVVSQFSSTTVLDKLQEKFDSFRDALIAQYVICYTSKEAPENNEIPGTYDKETLITLGTARRNDMVNVQIYGDYGNLRRLEYNERNQLLKAGISNIVKKPDGSYTLWDLVTFYHPQGQALPLYRYDRDITVLANCAYDIMNTFRDSDEWKSIILIADGDITSNPAARSLKDIKAEINVRIGLLGQAGFIANYVEAQKNTQIEIDSSNPNRVNMNPYFDITGVGRIFDIKNFVGFYFGG